MVEKNQVCSTALGAEGETQLQYKAQVGFFLISAIIGGEIKYQYS